MTDKETFLYNLALTEDETILALKIQGLKHPRKVVQKLARSGRLVGTKVGRGWLFSPIAITNFLLMKSFLILLAFTVLSYAVHLGVC